LLRGATVADLTLDYHIWNDEGEVAGPFTYEKAVEYLFERESEEGLYAENSDGDVFHIDLGEVVWE
jgi:hypothetical protein